MANWKNANKKMKGAIVIFLINGCNQNDSLLVLSLNAHFIVELFLPKN